ncbi:unnamed protein product [Urochloa humidicola]
MLFVRRQDIDSFIKHRAFCNDFERRWKCGLCSAIVRGDWKEHAEVCWGEDYGCECGAVFPRQDKDSFIKHRALCDVPPITLRRQDDDQVNVSGGAFGFGMGSNRHLMNRLWGTAPGADSGGSSSGFGGFSNGPFERGNYAQRGGCVAGACTRPEVPPLDSMRLSRPVLAAVARAHALANQHVCENCREYFRNGY